MTGKFRRITDFNTIPRGRRLVLIVWLFVGIVVCLLIAAVYSVELLSAGRAFVGAEGQWSRAQKDAAFQLQRYALTGEENYYEDFERAISVPLGDRKARLELLKDNPDFAVVRAGFTEGRNHPADIDAMITLYRRFRHFAPVLLVAGIMVSQRFVAQNEKLQETLRESESQLRHLIESAPMPLLIVRAGDQQMLYANERALQQLSLNADSLQARSLADFHVDPKIRAALPELLPRHGSVRDYEVHLKDFNGREFWLLLSAQPIRYGGIVGLLVALANIDDRKRMQDDMRKKAMHDQLTGLPNRASFLESLDRSMRKARRREGRFSVLFVDLDHFKEVNDSLGHAAGDQLLQNVADRLKGAVRESDLVARIGGDEFVVLIEEHRGPEEGVIVAQKILTFLERPVLLDWREVKISCSVGIASFPEDGDEVETLVKNADTAMYQAKERGRNNFQFYSADLNRLTLERAELERRVRLEIPEPALMQSSDTVDRAVRALQALGLQIAIDNFGTGYSSLGLVRGFAVQAVKIDKSLVSSCTNKRECAAIVGAVGAMAKNLGLIVIAAGVETEEEKKLVASLGCERAQGNLIGRAVDWAEITALAGAPAAVPAA